MVAVFAEHFAEGAERVVGHEIYLIRLALQSVRIVCKKEHGGEYVGVVSVLTRQKALNLSVQRDVIAVFLICRIGAAHGRVVRSVARHRNDVLEVQLRGAYGGVEVVCNGLNRLALAAVGYERHCGRREHENGQHEAYQHYADQSPF